MSHSQTDAKLQSIDKIREHIRITYDAQDITGTDILARELGFINSVGQPTKLGERLMSIFDQTNPSS